MTTLTFPALSSRVTRALRRLEHGASDAELAGIVGDHGLEALASWYYCLGVIERYGGIEYHVRDRHREFARAVVMSPYFKPGTGVVTPVDRWQLSRFAFLRRNGSHMWLESPLSCAKIELLDPRSASLIAALGTPTRASDVVGAVPDVSEQAATDLLALLEYTGMLTRVDASGRAAEDASSALQTWHFADLLFHSRCRAGRHDEPSDLFGFRGKLPYLPAVKAPMSRETIDLFVPDLASLHEHDVPFTHVLEERRSIREYDARPITFTQLGEFLYRVARVKRIIEPDGERLLYQASVRPYPGGGACYELETYVAVNRCEGLPVGLYHYDPLNHRLERIAGGEAHVAEFMRDTLIPVDAAGPRQLLIILAARFQRVAWKYNGSTYAAILKNAGVLYQTMYLVATAMNLAPCGLGGGNSELFARATGEPFVEETSIGEFMLGTKPARD